MLRAMAEHAERMTPAQLGATFEDMAGCAVLTDLLDGARDAGPMKAFAQLSCPVRIAWGGSDRMLPFKRYGAPMLAAVPGAESVILPGVGHVPMIDDPALVAAAILELVDNLGAARAASG
jgi:pimeloyl-ACP methyl ester carboxylesterase